MNEIKNDNKNNSHDFNDILNQPQGQELIEKEFNNQNCLKSNPKPMLPLPSTQYKAKTINPKMLPEIYSEFVENQAKAIGTSPDLIWAASHAICHGLIGRKLCIAAKKNNDWLCFPNNWGYCVASPSEKKTPALNASLELLTKVINKDRKKRLNQRKLIEHEITGLQKYIESRESEYKKLSKENTPQVREKFVQLSKEISTLKEQLKKIIATVPIKRFLINDTTPEALHQILAENKDGLLLVKDELFGLIKKFNQKNREGEREFMLSTWNGNDFYTMDRIGRGEVHAENLNLSIFGCLQPGKSLSMIRGYTGGSELDDGFIQRFQIAVFPEPQVEAMNTQSQETSNEIKKKIQELFGNLYHLDQSQFGHFSDKVDIPVLSFSDEAQILFNEWFSLLEDKIKKLLVENKDLSQHLGKYRSFIPEMALVIQVIRHFTEDASSRYVDKISLETAIYLSDFYESHAKKIYSQVVERRIQKAEVLAKRIYSCDLQEGMTLNDIKRKGWELLRSKQDIEGGLSVLEEVNWIKMIPSPDKTPGRPTERISFHPDLIKSILAKKEKRS